MSKKYLAILFIAITLVLVGCQNADVSPEIETTTAPDVIKETVVAPAPTIAVIQNNPLEHGNQGTQSGELLDGRYEVMFLTKEKPVLAYSIENGQPDLTSEFQKNWGGNVTLIAGSLGKRMGREVVLVDWSQPVVEVDGKPYVVAYSLSGSYIIQKAGLERPNYSSVQCDPRLNCDPETVKKILQAIWLMGGWENSIIYETVNSWTTHVFFISGVYVGNQTPVQSEGELPAGTIPLASPVILYSAEKNTLFISQLDGAFVPNLPWTWEQHQEVYSKPLVAIAEATASYDEKQDRFSMNCSFLQQSNPQISGLICDYFHRLDLNDQYLNMVMRGESTPDNYVIVNSGFIWPSITQTAEKYPVDLNSLIEGLVFFAR